MTKCSPPEQPILRVLKLQFNLHARCMAKRKSKQKQVEQQDKQRHKYKGNQPFMDNLCLLCSQLDHQAQHNPMEPPSSHLCIRHVHLHNRCNLHHLERLVVLWTAPGALSCHLRPMVLEEAVVVQMEVEHHPLHFLPMLAPTSNRERVRLSPYR